MGGIQQQFWGPMQIAEWITKEYNKEKIKSLLDQEPDPIDNYRELSFWVIGPKESEEGLFIYGHIRSEGGASEGKIASINPIDGMSMYIKTTQGKWFFLRHNQSLHSIAKKIDLFLMGVYTEIPLMDIDYLFRAVEDILEYQK